jgi:hypothetical protein
MNNQDSHSHCGTGGEQVTNHFTSDNECCLPGSMLR